MRKLEDADAERTTSAFNGEWPAINVMQVAVAHFTSMRQTDATGAAMMVFTAAVPRPTSTGFNF